MTHKSFSKPNLTVRGTIHKVPYECLYEDDVAELKLLQYFGKHYGIKINQ